MLEFDSKEEDKIYNIPLLSRQVSSLEKDLTKKKEQSLSDPVDANQKAETPKSTVRLFTLEESKYADFLQPKVVLSKSLTILLTKIKNESKESTEHSSAISSLSFHNYAKSHQLQ